MTRVDLQKEIMLLQLDKEKKYRIDFAKTEAQRNRFSCWK